MPRLLSSLFGAAMLLALVPAHGQDFEAGLLAYSGGDYAAALAEWRPLAEAGHAEARNKLGIMYANGQGVARDDAAAAGWFRLAAEAGNADAPYYLGAMYGAGLGVAQDYVRALMWSDIAAARGIEEAAAQRAWMASKLTPAGIAEAERLARAWMEAHQ